MLQYRKNFNIVSCYYEHETIVLLYDEMVILTQTKIC
jgi:hypothetical protein